MPGCVRKDVLGGCTGGHVYESDGMIKDHSVCKPVASSGECVTVYVVDPQSVCHIERATASVLDGANRATRSPSSLHGENESTRADPFPAVAGSAPSRTTVPNKAAVRGEARRGAGVLHTGRDGPQGPSGARPGLRTRPRPAPERNLEMDTRRPSSARTFTQAHARHTPRAVPKSRHPGGSRTLDSGSGAAASGRKGSTPPVWSEQQMQEWRLPGSVAVQSPRRAALWLPPPPPPLPELPRLPPAGLAGGPADSAQPSPAPAPRSHPAPRPGHAR